MLCQERRRGCIREEVCLVERNKRVKWRDEIYYEGMDLVMEA